MAPLCANVSADDYYEVLGVDRGASVADINNAYRRLAKTHHPDKVRGHASEEELAEATAAFQRINEANNVLSDSDKRRKYDLLGKDDAADCGSGRPVRFGTNPSDRDMAFFHTLFGNMAKGVHASGRIPADLDGLMSGAFGDRKSHNGVDVSRPGVRSHPHYAVPSGVAVVLRGLQNSPELNGQTGRVLMYDDIRMRYDVAVDGTGAGGAAKRVRPQCMTQLCGVEVTGVERKPELNGALGDIHNYDEASGRYMVLLRKPALAVALHRGNCVLQEGTRGVVTGVSDGRFEGQMAEVKTVDRAAGRYTVQCRGGEQIRIKFDKFVC